MIGTQRLSLPRPRRRVHDTGHFESPDIDRVEAGLIDRSRRQRRRAALSIVLLPIVVLGLMVAAWQIYVIATDTPAYLVPRPRAVLHDLVDRWDLLWSNGIVTLKEVLAAFLVAVVAGVALALLTYSSKLFDRGVYPHLMAFQAVPKVAIAPLLAIWFGFDLTMRSLMGALVAVFPIMISTLVGLRSIESETLLLARSIGLSRTRTFTLIRVPRALPDIFAGLRVGLSLAAIGVIVGEFIGGSNGLGYVVQQANTALDTGLLFAALLVLGGFMFILMEILRALESRLLRWHG
jgi:NitT/TauT family transport system permease protein